MISFLIGIIEEKREGVLELNVNGVGYELLISNNTLCALPLQGETVKVYTYMSIREDGVSLVGFSSMEEKELFLKLITVSGIGPKAGLAILSGLSISDLTSAIIKSDVKLLSTIKGLGKKTAERLCLELKGKLDITVGATTFEESYNEDAVQMATDTLVSLGINKNEAYMLARANATSESSVEDIIAKSLRGYKG